MDAEDKAEKQATRTRTKRGDSPDAPHAAAARRWAAEDKAAKAANPITETFYELSAGKKLLLCKRRASGTVYRTFVGSLDDNQNGPAIKAQIEKLQRENKLKIRM